MAASKADPLEVEPEDAQHFGDGGGGQTQINHGQHGQKVKHGLVETVFGLDHIQNSDVPHKGNQIHNTEWESNQICTVSSPGIPSRRKKGGWNWVSLIEGIFLEVSLNSWSESRITVFFLSMSPGKMKDFQSALEVMVKVVNLEILDILLFPESSQQLSQ